MRYARCTQKTRTTTTNRPSVCTRTAWSLDRAGDWRSQSAEGVAIRTPSEGGADPAIAAASNEAQLRANEGPCER
jgi:hypothetical protein